MTRGSIGWPALCVAAIFFSLLGPSLAAGVKDGRRLYVGPPGIEGWRGLFQDEDGWADARKQTGGLIIADHNLAKFSDDELRRSFEKLRSWDIKLELEVGVVKEWSPTGERTFRIEKPSWGRAISLGGALGSVAMDEPLVAARQLHKDDDYAIAETAAFIRQVRESYPSVAVGDIEPYPGIDLQAHKGWIKALQQRLQSMGVRGIDFYRLDIDWVAFQITKNGSWLQLKELSDYIQGANLPLSIIYWPSFYPMESRHGKADDETWYTGVMTEGYALDELGIVPGQYVIESWINAPARIVPDSAEFSFTRSVRDFGRKFVRQ